MLQHHKKLKELCITKGKVDGRKIKSKAFKEELLRIVNEDLDNADLEWLDDLKI